MTSLILEILYFPVWWYTIGLKKRFLEFIRGVYNLTRELALKLLFINLFKPMFGETSHSGRIISFFMRCLILTWRLILFLLGTILLLIFLFIWITLPIIAVWQIIKLSS